MGRKARDTSKRFRINDKVVDCLTVNGFAQEIGKSPQTIRRYERVGIIPEAPIKYNGVRYYPKTLISRVRGILMEFPQHTKPDPEKITQIHLIFKEEREKYANG